MNDQQPKHVFISYVRENQTQVDRLCADLEKAGVNVWLDRTSINPGARWKAAIQEAIRNGNFFIACFSKEYTSKGKTHMNEELVLAIEELRKYPPDQEWFIPVLLSECDVPARSIGAGETILDINWVPLYENWDVGIQKILLVIKPISPKIQNLITAIRTKDEEIRSRAILVLDEIADYSAVPSLVPALIEALKNKSDTGSMGFLVTTRVAAAHFLGKMGRLAKAAVPALIEALKDEEKSLRRQAAMALGKIGSEAKPAVSALIEVIRTKDPDVFYEAVEALRKIGMEAKSDVSTLINLLKAENPPISTFAENCLKNINTPEARKALEEYRRKSN